MSVSDDSDHTLELTDIHDDTSIFDGLVEDLMRRTSLHQQQSHGYSYSKSDIKPASLIRHFKLDSFGAQREPSWKNSGSIDLFFHAIALHPLESIQIENVGMYPYEDSATFPIRLLTRLLQSTTGTAPSNLLTLELRDAILEGSTDEWEAFAETLGGLQKLQVFVLETCDCAINFPSEQFTNFNMIFQQLLRGPVQQAQRLQELSLVPAQNYGGNLESTTVESILRQSRSLQKLTISNIGRLDGPMTTAIFSSLTQQQTIRGHEEAIIRQPPTSSLELMHLKNCQMDRSALAALLGLLGSQPENLKTIHIGLLSSPSSRGDRQYIHEETPMIELFTALKLNRTLEKFVLSSDGTPQKMSSKASNAYLEMMQLNCSLLGMFVTYPNLHFHPHVMDFYGKLNRVGRRKFLQESHLVTREEWVNKLASVTDDESCLFYFLRLNPLLCSQF